MVWNILYGVCWLGYLGSLSYIVLFKASWDETCQFMEMLSQGTMLEPRKVYLRPFESTMLFLRNWEYAYARWNVFGNMLLFVPFGVLLGVSCRGKKGLLLSFMSSFVVSLCFEIIQYLYAIGEFDVDDIMLNVIGAVAGYGLLCAFCRVMKWIKEQQDTKPNRT